MTKMNTQELNPNEVVVLTNTEKAVKSLEKVVGDVEKVTALLPTFHQTLNDISEEVAIKSNELRALETKVETVARENAIELDFRVRENSNRVLNELLDERESVAVKVDELVELKANAKYNEESVESDIAAAVKRTEETLGKEHKNTIELIKLQNSTNAAKDTAKIEQLEATIDNLKEQLKAAVDRETASLAASIKIAEAGSGVVVNTTSK